MTTGKPEPPDLARLSALGEPDGSAIDEAARSFANLRGTPHERRAIDLLLAYDARAPLPDSMLVELASTLLERGDRNDARRVLARATSPSALILRADLAAETGDTAKAIELVEQVLFRDVDWPGARERHARWTGSSCFDCGPRVAGPLDTVVTNAPDAPFELVREMGRGGTATVYEAVDRLLGRHVALKIYHRPDRDRAQLEHEARVAVVLSGRGIVRVFDVDPQKGWLALEWAPLGALSMWIRSRRLDRILPLGRWAVPLAAALGRVHDAGWVHHDVKPANVALRSIEAPVLTDFGIARRIGEPSPLGSAGYVSPERRAGRTSDPRDDVYGYGRVLENALEACAAGGHADAALGPWRSLVAICTGPDEGRPEGGADLLARASGVADG